MSTTLRLIEIKPVSYKIGGETPEYAGIATPVTTKGLMKWAHKMHSKLAYMSLAKSQGKLHKVESYKKSLLDWMASAVKKLDDLKSEDHKTDLQITIDNVKLLINNSKILLN